MILTYSCHGGQQEFDETQRKNKNQTSLSFDYVMYKMLLGLISQVTPLLCNEFIYCSSIFLPSTKIIFILEERHRSCFITPFSTHKPL